MINKHFIDAYKLQVYGHIPQKYFERKLNFLLLRKVSFEVDHKHTHTRWMQNEEKEKLIQLIAFIIHIRHRGRKMEERKRKLD